MTFHSARQKGFHFSIRDDSAEISQNSVSRRRKLNEWDLSPSLFLCLCLENGIIGITGFLFYRFTLVCQQIFYSSFDPFLLYEMQVERDTMQFSISTS